jgi:CubicO group peptidase (beta-lactamase class C family)
MQKRLFDPLGMKDTTFWPSEEQAARIAKAYKPNAAKDGLDETTISQLTYPLTDRRRQPMPAGGLFSTAFDVCRFCQMILNGGEIDGHRYVSESAVKQMTAKQTAETLKDGYGLGFSTGGGNFGHGGALATNMNIDSNRGLITIFLVQHSGFPGDGKNAGGAFRKAAEKIFGKK